jgi:hypothetical protein
MSDEERARFVGEGPLEYSHTMTEQIGGQIDAGFVLTNFIEAPHHDAVSRNYMPGYFATRALKPRSGP